MHLPAWNCVLHLLVKPHASVTLATTHCMKEKNETDAAGNGFMAVLQRKETQVGTLSEASGLLAKAVQAAVVTGKKATVTLVLECQPKLGAVNFVTKLKSTIPAEEEPLCIFYADSDGQLHRDDPRQKELELRSVEGGRPETQIQEEAAAI